MTQLADEKLGAIKAQLQNGVVASHETVRSLLLWFSAERRGPRVVSDIRAALANHGLKTEPDFENVWLDEQIRFLQAGAVDDALLADPLVRIGRIEAANRSPIYVPPDATISQAVTIMLANDYSQLPVMTGPRDVKGVVSWKTIGSRFALGRPCTTVAEAMENAVISSSEEPLFDAIAKIAENDYLLVQARDRSIVGIVTASDFNAQFRTLAEPFLLIGEIEMGLRRLLHQKFTAVELAAVVDPGAAREVKAVSDLTLGEYIKLLEAPATWERLNIAIDRVEFVKQLDRVREIRNDVMHFDPDGLDPDDITTLREFSRFMKRLREVGCA